MENLFKTPDIEMDFKSIISSTRNYNFHSHTQYCDGRAPMSAMAAAAVACGMRHYGFTPHSPLPIESPCNMSADCVADYFAEVRRLQSDPAFSGCRFYAGMEIDYLGPQWNAASDYFRNLPLDYTIGSVHFIPSQDGEYIDVDGRPEHFKVRLAENFRGDIEYVVDTFYRQTLDMVKIGCFDILGHFDKIGHNASKSVPGIAESSFYRSCIEPLLNCICERRITVELNTKARSEHGFFFPSERYLGQLLESGVTVLVNSDAHFPDRICASRDEAFEILDRIYPNYERKNT